MKPFLAVLYILCILIRTYDMNLYMYVAHRRRLVSYSYRTRTRTYHRRVKSTYEYVRRIYQVQQFLVPELFEL